MTRGDTILDLTLNSNESLVDNVNIDEPFVSSDHCVVRFDITCNISMKDCYFDYRHGNYEGMKIYPAEMDWSILLNYDGVLEVWLTSISCQHNIYCQSSTNYNNK